MQDLPHPGRAIAAEAAGTFFVVLAGCGAILAGGSLLPIALAFGLTVAAMVYALGHVSGAHFNPAVTLAFAATRHFPWRHVPAYVGAQLAGATAAAFLLRLLHGDIGIAASGLAYGVSWWEALLVEAVASAMLAFVILAVATDPRAQPAAAGLAIGFAVAVGALWAGTLTGGSMNPARSLGPAIAALRWADLWVWTAGPPAGAVAGMWAYEALRGEARRPAKAAGAARGKPLGALGPVEGR